MPWERGTVESGGCEKDSGVGMDKQLNVKTQCESAAKRANVSTLDVQTENSECKEAAILPLSMALVRSVLHYCAQAWSLYFGRLLESWQGYTVIWGMQNMPYRERQSSA